MAVAPFKAAVLRVLRGLACGPNGPSARPVALREPHHLRADVHAVRLAVVDVAPVVDAAVQPRDPRLVAAAAENVEWPDGYAGTFGRPITVLIDGSIFVGRGLK